MTDEDKELLEPWLRVVLLPIEQPGGPLGMNIDGLEYPPYSTTQTVLNRGAVARVMPWMMPLSGQPYRLHYVVQAPVGPGYTIAPVDHFSDKLMVKDFKQGIWLADNPDQLHLSSAQVIHVRRITRNGASSGIVPLLAAVLSEIFGRELAILRNEFAQDSLARMQVLRISADTVNRYRAGSE